jgi:hypothetical protein
MRPSPRLAWLCLLAAACGPTAEQGADGGGGAEDASPDDARRFVDAAPLPDVATICDGDPALADPPGCASLGVQIDPFYAGEYTCFDLGAVPGVPPQKYGGLTLLPGTCQTTLIIGGEANYPEGALYEIQVARDGFGHIGAFVGGASYYAEAAYNDGGVVFGPGDVLFLARWPQNELGQILPGSAGTDKVIDLSAFGVASSPGGLGFVPMDFGGGGQLKLVSWPGGEWYTLAIAPDGAGTYDVTGATGAGSIVGGPEGFTYVKAGNPDFAVDSMLVSEWSASSIATYEVDAQGNPAPGTRRTFLTGLTGAEGAYRDPDTGDFFFSTWSFGADRVIVVRGFLPIIE